MPETKKLLPTFTLTITVSQQWGDIQEVSVDTLLLWSARLAPELGIKLLDAIRPIVQEILPGAIVPISQSGQKALETLGKDQQLPLPVACALPIDQ